MLKECNLFRNSEPMEWWLNRVRANCIEEEIIKDHKKFIDEINGDINDFENISVENVLNGYEFEKSRLFELLNDCRIDSYDYELLLHKRATIHIKELFNHYVDDETLVVISSFQHISAEREIEKCKHIIRLDEEDEHSNFIYNIDKVIDEGKKYKKVFVYIIGTEFESGRRHDNSTYKALHDKLNENNIPNIMVLDAVQEMFLYPRDYSFYHFVIGTVHSLYYLFDTGLLFINKNMVPEEDIKSFTGYKRSDILDKINVGLRLALGRKEYILMYNNIIEDSIDHNLFSGFSKHNSMPNFWSAYKQGKFLSDECVKKFIDDTFVKHSLYKDPGFNVEISHHKSQDELFVRVRAQTMMFFPKEVEEKLFWFYNNYCRLAQLVIMTLEKG